ncbi:MAG: PGPGW domain-containing protein [Planctomycetota bacterium]
MEPYLILILTFVSIAMLVGSAFALPLVAVRLPADYFIADRRQRKQHRKSSHPARVIAKNLLGVILVIAGIAMLVLPGQGILSIVAGLALIDFPGKHRLQRFIVLRTGAHRLLNRMRRKAGQEPLELRK